MFAAVTVANLISSRRSGAHKPTRDWFPLKAELVDISRSLFNLYYIGKVPEGFAFPTHTHWCVRWKQHKLLLRRERSMISILPAVCRGKENTRLHFPFPKHANLTSTKINIMFYKPRLPEITFHIGDDENKCTYTTTSRITRITCLPASDWECSFNFSYLLM